MIAILAGSARRSEAEPPKPDSLEFFHQQVEPLLKSACYECHSHATGEANGKLMVDSLNAMQDGGTRGPAIKPGSPDESWLWKAVTYSDAELQMPPDGKLPDEQIALLRTWIEAGAVAPEVGTGHEGDRECRGNSRQALGLPNARTSICRWSRCHTCQN